MSDEQSKPDPFKDALDKAFSEVVAHATPEQLDKIHGIFDTMVRGRLKAVAEAMADFTQQTHRSSSPLLMLRPNKDSDYAVIVSVVVGKLTDADMVTFKDFHHGFVQDTHAGKCRKITEDLKVDLLTKPQPEEPTNE